MRPFARLALDHIVQRARDLDASLRFHREVLGCALDKVQERIGLRPVRAGEGVPFDERAIRAHWAAQGVAVVDSGPHCGARGGGPSIYVADPDGNTIELKGPADR